MKKVLVYTCVTNDYDWLLPPVWRSPYVHYVCFTDNSKMNAKGWEMRPLPSVYGLSCGTAANRYCKFFPWKVLPDHDWSLYIDANIRLMSDPSGIVAAIESAGAEMAIPTHPQRSDIWQEADACKRLAKVATCDHGVLDNQLMRYEVDGLPVQSGLTENNIIFRSGDSSRLMPVMEQWWEELRSGVRRDQISLPYVLWSTGTAIHRLPFSARDENPYFRIVSHRRGGGLYSYLQARQYHGAFWAAAFHSLRMARAIPRRVTGVRTKLGIH
ncbi:glycosyltransferase domain-containing protein [Spiribacter sp. 1M153]|uniref:glycosyltransferase domain-containing protein n=1 Tax=Spiribacter roseus TaxID=1855875 RepID=UPI00349F0CB2